MSASDPKLPGPTSFAAVQDAFLQSGVAPETGTAAVMRLFLPRQLPAGSCIMQLLPIKYGWFLCSAHAAAKEPEITRVS